MLYNIRVVRIVRILCLSPREGGKRIWQKLKSEKASLWTALFVALRDSVPAPVSLPSFAKESIMKSPA